MKKIKAQAMKSGFSYSIISVIVFIMLFACSDPATEVDKSVSAEGLYSLADGRGSFSSAGGSGNSNGDTTVYQAGVITAGEWNDNANWDYWNDLLANQEYNEGLSGWGLNPTSRLAVKLEDNAGRSLIDAVVEVKNSLGITLWRSKTDNFGKALLWPGLFNPNDIPEKVSVDYFGKKFTFNASQFSETLTPIKVPVAREQINDADIAFVVDATGSMGDELEYLKAEMNDVLSRASQNNCSNWRLGSVYYRDEGDDYVTKVSPFTANSSTIINFIKEQRADGGGDWPEAVHTALHAAIDNLNWSMKARTRLLFLVLDAPPHNEATIVNALKVLIAQAAQKGIKIIPVVASGIDKNTEFLMRSWSLVTNGTYVFITDHSGIGNDHLEPTVGNYTVEKLNDLLVRLIYQYTSCTSE